MAFFPQQILADCVVASIVGWRNWWRASSRLLATTKEGNKSWALVRICLFPVSGCLREAVYCEGGEAVKERMLSKLGSVVPSGWTFFCRELWTWFGKTISLASAVPGSKLLLLTEGNQAGVTNHPVILCYLESIRMFQTLKLFEQFILCKMHIVLTRGELTSCCFEFFTHRKTSRAQISIAVNAYRTCIGWWVQIPSVKDLFGLYNFVTSHGLQEKDNS